MLTQFGIDDVSFMSIKKIFKRLFESRVPLKRASTLHDCLEGAPDCRGKRWKCWRWAGLILAVTLIYYWSREIDTQDTSFIEERKDRLRLLNTYATEREVRTVPLEKPPRKETTTEEPAPIKHCIPSKPSDKRLELKILALNESLESLYPMVKTGGYYHPADCSPKQKVAILVPYRDRETSLTIFLYNIHPFLMKQQLEYQIFVVEQDGDNLFNKGRLINAGFKEMLKIRPFDCVVIHDVDLVPLDERILYSCPTFPRHMSTKIRDEDLKAINQTKLDPLFGGVVSMTVEQFERANGYSNMYFGWGAEDNDMFYRLHGSGYPIVKYNTSVAVYAMLPHKRQRENNERFTLLGNGLKRYKTDGLSNIEYDLLSIDKLHLYTRIYVDIILTDKEDIETRND